MSVISTLLFLIPLVASFQLSPNIASRVIKDNSPKKVILNSSIKKEILFIGSYSVDWVYYDDEVAGLASELTSDNYSIEYTYLKGKRVDFSEEYLDFLVDHYSNLCEYTDYDAIIISDDDALNFVMDNNENEGDVFYNIPSFFLGVNDAETAEIATSSRDNVYGIIETNDYKGVMEYIDQIMPNATTFNYIADSTSTGESTGGNLENTALSSGYFTEINRINPSVLTQDELIDALKDIGEDEVTFLTGFSTDITSNFYTLDEQYSLMEEYLKSPLFTDDPLPDDNKIVSGSVVYGYEEAGVMIGNSIRKYFANGLDIANEDLLDEQPNEIVFDCDVLSKYNLDYRLLGDDVTLVNKPISFTETYGIGFRLVSFTLAISVFIFWILFHQVALIKKRNKDIIALNTKITKLIYKDSMTGLYRNSVFKEDIKSMISAGKPFALILANADDLGYINSYFGREKGDEILLNMSTQFSTVPGFNYNSYHFGGDEAIILLPFKRISEVNVFIKKEKMISGGKITRKTVKEHFTNTMGISLYPQDGTTSNRLIDDAYAAMISGKKRGKNIAVRYSSNLFEAGRENGVKNMLNNALANDKFELYYQPIVDIKTGDIFKYEALLRIKDVRMSPGIFIPVAEETGSIIAIGKIVVKQAMEFIAEMKREGITKKVSINFSNRQVDDKDFSTYFATAAKSAGVERNSVDLEITESFLFINSKARGRLFNFFKENNIALSIDDFGTGYSSVNSLFSTPIKYVKVDKSLSERMCKNKPSTKSIVSFFHELGLKVIFEGIEEKEQVKVCNFCKVDYIQGYYFSKPQPRDITLKSLDKNYLDLIK